MFGRRSSKLRHMCDKAETLQRSSSKQKEIREAYGFVELWPLLQVGFSVVWDEFTNCLFEAVNKVKTR
jgi:hypothetical protein